MKIKSSFRIEKVHDDALEKIKIKENSTKTDAINHILELGLEAYFNKKESRGDEKNLSTRFDELEKKMDSFSVQMKDLDYKSFRINISLTEFIKENFQDNVKFASFNNNISNKMDEYKKQIKLIPKFGIIILKYVNDISNRKIPGKFCDEIKSAHLAIMGKK